MKDDDDEVKKLGIRYGIEMCQKILKSGLSPGLHFYSLNLESSVVAIIDGLGFITHTEAIRSLPWRPSTMDKRRTEKVGGDNTKRLTMLMRSSLPTLQWRSALMVCLGSDRCDPCTGPTASSRTFTVHPIGTLTHKCSGPTVIVDHSTALRKETSFGTKRSARKPRRSSWKLLER